MKILVTGAAGFIGSHLAERLIFAGHKVVGLDCLSDYYATELKDLNLASLKSKGIIFHKLDLAQDDLSSVMENVDIIYHLAAQPGLSKDTTPETYYRNNVTATKKILEACKQQSQLKLFVHISTSSVYGIYATAGEDKASNPVSDYGRTKLEAEQLVMDSHKQDNLSACILRLFSVYGPRERPEKLYPKLLKSILENKELCLYEGALKHQRSYTYVTDIVGGLIKVLNNIDQCKGEIINLGSDKCITTGQGIEIVETYMNTKAKLKIVPARQGDQLKTHANIDKARKLLGYDPKVLPEEGLKQEVNWFRNNWGSIKDYY